MRVVLLERTRRTELHTRARWMLQALLLATARQGLIMAKYVRVCVCLSLSA